MTRLSKNRQAKEAPEFEALLAGPCQIRSPGSQDGASRRVAAAGFCGGCGSSEPVVHEVRTVESRSCRTAAVAHTSPSKLHSQKALLCLQPPLKTASPLNACLCPLECQALFRRRLLGCSKFYNHIPCSGILQCPTDPRKLTTGSTSFFTTWLSFRLAFVWLLRMRLEPKLRSGQHSASRCKSFLGCRVHGRPGNCFGRVFSIGNPTEH